MKPYVCGKLCHPESQAKALALVSTTYRRAYYCTGCKAWHTTSQPTHKGSESTLYRIKTPAPLPL